ncbi:MAG TPA: hypothetical protein VFP97_05760 [Chitinophagaceae bacterium]|nr:hypothetical protein [Chitinophagaceae bacterium]
MNESLVSSNKMISASTKEVMVVLKNKLHEPGSEERAKVWYPKAEEVQRLSKDIFDHIEGLKQNIYDTILNNSELFKKLKNYEAQLLQIDPKITQHFQRSLKIFTHLIDTSKHDQGKLFKAYFQDVSAEATIALLTKIQNNIRLNEVRMVTFCNEHVGRTGSYYPVINYVIILNTTLAQPKASIELTAGMLSFERQPRSEVFVYGKKIELTDDSFAHYKFKAASKPGKYYVPVKISFVDLSGKQQTIEREVEYTVAKIQKQ